jgi:hypothetical protein
MLNLVSYFWDTTKDDSLLDTKRVLWEYIILDVIRVYTSSTTLHIYVNFALVTIWYYDTIDPNNDLEYTKILSTCDNQ